MADISNRYPINAPGPFYVESACIDCDLCREQASGFFTRDDDAGHSYVYKQPTTQEEIDLCNEALSNCPVEAIGNDGAAVPA